VTDPSLETFGEKLAKLRKERFLSRNALAVAADVPEPTIRDLERGKTRSPRLATIKSLADALELSGAERSEFEDSAQEHARKYPRKSEDEKNIPVGQWGNAAAGPERVVHTLPRDIRSFTGREPEVRELVDAARDVAREGSVGSLFSVEGMGGIGKTTLAVHAAHMIIEEFPERFPDGYVFLDLRGYSDGLPALTAHQALRALLIMLHVSNSAIPPERALRELFYSSVMAGKSALVILDNVRDAAQVKPLLAGLAKCMVIVTSRENLRSLDDAKVVSLGTPPEADAIALFRAVSGRNFTASGDTDDAAQIVRLCGYLPLAVRIVAARLSRRPALDMADVLTELDQEHNRLANLHDEERSVTAVFQTSLRHLADPSEQRLFKQLALIPGPDFDAYAAASLSGDSFHPTRRRLESLLDHNLLVQRTAGRYQFHDLVRAFARTLRTPAADQAIDNLLNFYLYVARLADQLFERGLPRADVESVDAEYGGISKPAALPELRTSAQAQAWLSAEGANLRTAARFAARNGRPRITIALSAALSDFLRAYGPWSPAMRLHFAALKAAVDASDLPGQATAYRSIGGVQSRTGDITQSQEMLGKALDIYRQLGDQRGAARALIELGIAQRAAGDGACLDGFSKALDIYRELGEQRGQAAALNELGSMQWQNGPIPAAERNLQEALRIYRELDNRQGEAAALLYLANVQLTCEAFDAAIESLDQAERIGRDLGQPVLVANSLLYRGDVQRTAGSLDEAKRAVSDALESYRKLNHRQGIATALTYLGETLTLAGQHALADEHFQQAVATFDELGDLYGKAEALNSYATLARAAGQPELAGTRYAEALELAVKASSARDQADALTGLASLAEQEDRRDQAAEGYREALSIYLAMESGPDIARIKQALSRLTTGPGTG
jgi:tetratricopeptide (TPR) repeat protein/transcriptional regulator with XRE-family HTH domain